VDVVGLIQNHELAGGRVAAGRAAARRAPAEGGVARGPPREALDDVGGALIGGVQLDRLPHPMSFASAWAALVFPTPGLPWRTTASW